MQAAMYHGQRDIRIEDIGSEPLDEHSVRVDIATCGICGSDLHEFTAGPIFIPEEPHPITGEQLPIPMGHEFGGTISEVGSAVTEFEVGDTVAVNPVLACGDCPRCTEGNYHLCDSVGFVGLSGGGGGFAESVVVSAEQAVSLNGDVPVDLGALIEPLAVGLHAVRRSGLKAGDRVAIFGSGPIGLGITQLVQAAGASEIFVSEPQTARRELAGSLGATQTIDPTDDDAVSLITAETDGGVDVAFEVAGVEPSVRDAIGSVRPSGTCTVVSIFEEPVSIQLNDIVIPERQLVGTLGYLAGPLSRREFGAVIDLIGNGAIDVDPLITGRIGLDEIVESGFEALKAPESDHIKILVDPSM